MGELRSVRDWEESDGAVRVDPLDRYLAEIRDTPLLDAAEQSRLCRVMVESERSIRTELARVPETARQVVRLWHDRQRRGLVSGWISHNHRDGSEVDESGEMDRKLAAVEATLNELEKKKSHAARVTLESIRSRLARQLTEAHVALPILTSILERLPRCADPSELGRAEDLPLILRRAEESLARLSDAKNIFITRNLRLVIHCAKSYRGQGVSFIDLVQEGNLGLIRAVEKFDHTRGYKFSTYAVWWIEQALVRALQNEERLVRVPSPLRDQQRRLKQLERSFRACRAAEPSDLMLAEAVAETVAEVDELRRSLMPEVSFEAPVGHDGELTVGDSLASPDLPPSAEGLDREALGRILRSALKRLPERDRRVIEWRFGVGGEPPQALARIGEALGVSRERVRQIEKKALVLLRDQAVALDIAGELEIL